MDPIIRSAAVTAVPRQLRRPNAVGAPVATVAATPVEEVAPVAPVVPVLPVVAAGFDPEPVAVPPAPTVEELTAAAREELARARETLAQAEEQERRWQDEHEAGQARLAALEADLAAREETLRQERAALDAACVGAQEAAAARGHEEGLAQGQAEGRAGADAAVARRLRELDAIVKDAAAVTARLLADQESTLVDVAYAAICRLAGDAAASRDGALAQVRAAVAQLRDTTGLRIGVHPDDAAWLAEHASSQDGGWTLQADARVTLGGCIVEGSHGTLDARLELQLDRLREALLATRAERMASSLATGDEV